MLEKRLGEIIGKAIEQGLKEVLEEAVVKFVGISVLVKRMEEDPEATEEDLKNLARKIKSIAKKYPGF